MKKFKDFVKRFVPTKIWLKLNHYWYELKNFAGNIGPYERKMAYCGYALHYNRGNNIIGRLKNESVYEEDMCLAIESDLKKLEHPVFLDIGINIGLITLHALRSMPGLKVFGFEPGPVQRKSLEMTLRDNGLGDRVTVVPDALGEKDAQANFYTHDPKHVAVDGLVDTRRGRDPKSIQVHVRKFDEWWKNSGKPHIGVAKIDVEGAELWVLKGATEFLRDCRPVIYMEIEPRNLRVYPYTYLDILDFMQVQNYGLFTLSGDKVTKDNMTDLISSGEDTYVARPAGAH